MWKEADHWSLGQGADWKNLRLLQKVSVFLQKGILRQQVQSYRQMKSLQSASVSHTRCCAQRVLIMLQNISANIPLTGGILPLCSSF